MKKKIVAYCYEGLGNRLDTLIAAAFIAKRYNCELSMFWVSNQISFDIELSDMFDNMKVSILDESEFDSFFKNNSSNMFAMSRNFSNIANYVPLHSCENFNCNVSLQQLDTIDKEIIFIQTCTIPPWCMNEYALKAFYEYFKIKPQLIKPPLAKIGIHIRGTDMFEDLHIKGAGVKKAVDYAIEVAQKHKNQMIFICSDDEQIESSLRQLKEYKFVMYDKVYVEKREAQSDFNKNLNKNGLVYSYSNLNHFEYKGKQFKDITQTNLVRSKEQILGGITDLFALAQVDNLYSYETSKISTFFALAKLIKQLDCFPEFVKRDKKQRNVLL